MKTTTRRTHIYLEAPPKPLRHLVHAVNRWLQQRGREPYELGDIGGGWWYKAVATITVDDSTPDIESELHFLLRGVYDHMRDRLDVSIRVSVETETIEPGPVPAYVSTAGIALPLGLPGFTDALGIAARARLSGYRALAAGFAAF